MPPQDKWPATFMVLTWLTAVAVTVLVSESLLNDLHLTGGQTNTGGPTDMCERVCDAQDSH